MQMKLVQTNQKWSDYIMEPVVKIVGVNHSIAGQYEFQNSGIPIKKKAV